MKQPVIFLTLGHSGSSALLKALSDCGLWLGGLCIDGLTGRNYYENVFHVRRNKSFLGKYERGAVIQDSMLAKYMTPTYVSQLRDAADAEMQEQGLGKDVSWGWKDPRTIQTYPIWSMVYPNAKWVCLFRTYYDVMLDRFYIKHPDRLEARTRRYYDVMFDMKENGKPLFYLHYDALVFDFANTFKRLCEFCELEVSKERIAKARQQWRPKYFGKLWPC